MDSTPSARYPRAMCSLYSLTKGPGCDPRQRANAGFAVVSLIHSAVCWLRYASEIPHEKAGDATPGVGHRCGPC